MKEYGRWMKRYSACYPSLDKLSVRFEQVYSGTGIV
jgi:hypothetical protein